MNGKKENLSGIHVIRSAETLYSSKTFEIVAQQLDSVYMDALLLFQIRAEPTIEYIATGKYIRPCDQREFISIAKGISGGKAALRKVSQITDTAIFEWKRPIPSSETIKKN